MNIPKADWIGRRGLFFALSGAMCLISVAAIAVKGFNYGIDFTGGSMVVLTYEQPRSLGDVRSELQKAGYPEANPQSFSGTNSFAVFMQGERGQAQDAASVETFLSKLRASAAVPFRVDRKEFVGPTVGRHLKKQAATAIVLAMLAIILYVAFRFDNPVWGAAGVVAIGHDVLITAGVFSLLSKEVDLVVVAAFLTIAGYSINDSIVIFDRMREILRTRRAADIGEIANDAINEMMSRTLMTNGLVLAVVAILFIFGGKVIHDFAFAMVVGSLVGTYSTVAIATPLVYHWTGRRGIRPEGKPSIKPKSAGKP